MFLLEAVWNSVVSVATEELNGPILRACVGYRITAEPLFLLRVSTSQQNLQLTGTALAGQKFDKLTCWKGGIL
jgi:hypothetical protein